MNSEIPCDFEQRLTPFQKLIVLKVFRPEKLLFAFSKYVSEQLGPKYAESPPASVEAVYRDSNRITPSIFVLSSGADPTTQVIKFAETMNFKDKILYTSLGQG